MTWGPQEAEKVLELARQYPTVAALVPAVARELDEPNLTTAALEGRIRRLRASHGHLPMLRDMLGRGVAANDYQPELVTSPRPSGGPPMMHNFRVASEAREPTPKPRPLTDPPGRRHIIIPDTQIRAGVPIEHLRWIGAYIAEHGTDRIVILGDWWDMPSLSIYDSAAKKAKAGVTRLSDIDSGNQGAELLMNELARGGWSGPVDYLEGNHDGFAPLGRCGRHLAANPDEDTLSPELFAYSWLGWNVHPFPQPVELDSILYCHLFGTTKWGAPSARAQMNRVQQSCIAGHKPGLDIHAHPRPGRDRCRWSAVIGSCYLHDEEYRGQNHYWRGILVAHDIQDDGSFDPMPVSLQFLQRRFG